MSKFTIIIPTRERADVLWASLKTAVMQDYDNLEIIVSDNFSKDHTREVVESFKDRRIKYINTGKRLSMSHNWEFALSHLTNGWVTILGDDDGLLPGAINKVADISNHFEVQAIRSNISSYLWPSTGQTLYGKLTISLRRGYELRNSEYWLRRALYGSTSTTSLPMLYTGGFVRADLIQRARDDKGMFYRSMIPDVYSAMAFSRLTNQFLFVHEPLAIGGSSKHSNGASAIKSLHGKNTEETPLYKFMNEPNMPFHSALPTLQDGGHLRLNSVLVLESFLQTENLKGIKKQQIAPEKMLEIVLRGAKRSQYKETLKWAELFTERYGIPFKKASLHDRFFDKMLKYANRLQHKNYTLTITGTKDLPIRDVYEASIVASTLKRIRPSRFPKLLQIY